MWSTISFKDNFKTLTTGSKQEGASSSCDWPSSEQKGKEVQNEDLACHSIQKI